MVAEEARTLAFIVLVTANAALIFPSRSPDSHWTRLLSRLTPVTTWALGRTLLGLAVVTGVPRIASAFGFLPPSLMLGLAAFFVGAGMVVLFSACKALVGKT